MYHQKACVLVFTVASFSAYSDPAMFGPMCPQVWLQLEEKRIPYIMEKVSRKKKIKLQLLQSSSRSQTGLQRLRWTLEGLRLVYVYVRVWFTRSSNMLRKRVFTWARFHSLFQTQHLPSVWKMF